MAKNKRKNLEQAVAWINVSIKLADGTMFKLPKGIPLHASNRKESAIIEAMRGTPDVQLDMVGDVIYTDGTVTVEPLIIKL